nr:1-acyl-sn-glycerol-3-phosphate acyltransferase [Anaerolineaceae bacterium]
MNTEIELNNLHPYETPSHTAIAAIVEFELFEHFKLQNKRLIREALRPLIHKAVMRVAEVSCKFDQKAGEDGLHGASKLVQDDFLSRLDVQFNTPIPEEGPLLIISNHPGGMESIALMAGLNRPDIHIFANQRPYFLALKNLSKFMVYQDPQENSHFLALKKALEVLRKGQALIMFPYGTLEPDPALIDGAEKLIQNWSRSISLFLSRVPDLNVLPVIISNVLTRKAFKNPL